MKPDTYTKAVLTVVAIMLSLLAVKPLISPDTTAQAQGTPFAGVQFVVDRGDLEFFDPRTGEVWEYFDSDGKLSSGGRFKAGQLARRLKLHKFGEPMTEEYEAK
jgi:hypothetical protein